MRILIIAPSWIGDTVAAQPLFMRLRQLYPDSVLDVLAPPWVAAVLRAMPQINGIVIDNPFAHGQLRLKNRWHLARELAKHHYEAAYVLPNSLKSALIPWFAGIPKRVGFTGEARYGLINVRHTLDEAALPLQVQRYAQLAQTPGQKLPELPNPQLQVQAEHVENTLEALGFGQSPPPIIFCPGAEYGAAKRWPEAHFAKLAQRFAEQSHPVWLLGSEKDKAVGEEIVNLSGGAARNLCGKTNLTQAVHLLAAARLVVSNDSGLMHVSAALGVPLIALFGSSSPRYTPPLSEQARVIWLELDCAPCFKRECPLGHLNCLQHITPEQVFAQAHTQFGL